MILKKKKSRSADLILMLAWRFVTLEKGIRVWIKRIKFCEIIAGL